MSRGGSEIASVKATTFVPRHALRSALDPTNTRRAQHRPQWLDGVSDVLAGFLRRLRETPPFATTKTRPDLRLPRTTRPRFALLGGQRSKMHRPTPPHDLFRAETPRASQTKSRFSLDEVAITERRNAAVEMAHLVIPTVTRSIGRINGLFCESRKYRKDTTQSIT